MVAGEITPYVVGHPRVDGSCDKRFMIISCAYRYVSFYFVFEMEGHKCIVTFYGRKWLLRGHSLVKSVTVYYLLL